MKEIVIIYYLLGRIPQFPALSLHKDIVELFEAYL